MILVDNILARFLEKTNVENVLGSVEVKVKDLFAKLGTSQLPTRILERSYVP